MGQPPHYHGRYGVESTHSGVRVGVGQQHDKTGADVTRERRQELLAFLFECESLAQGMVSAAPNSALMEHAVALCEGYLKTMLDMHHVWQRLQRAQEQGSDLKAQLEKMQTVLQEVSQQASRNAHRDQNKEAQARYWNTVGGLIDEVLRLSRQQTPISPPTRRTPEDPEPTPTTRVQDGHCEPASATLVPKAPSPFPGQQAALQLTAHLFGKFKASLGGRDMRRWPRGKGLKIFKFLLLHRASPVSRERLMETFWRDTEARAARNNLNVALYHLRQDLSRYHKTFPFVSHHDGYYQLNTELAIWVDVEAFDHAIHSGQQHDARHETVLAITAYRNAEGLYQGDCLQEDTHEEWAALISQAYRMKYLSALDYLGKRMLENGDYQECVTLWHKAVTLDSCNEQAHRRIMHCYLQMGQRQMALRQYQLCAESLKKELGLEPTPQTRQLLEQIRHASR